MSFPLHTFCSQRSYWVKELLYDCTLVSSAQYWEASQYLSEFNSSSRRRNSTIALYYKVNERSGRVYCGEYHRSLMIRPDPTLRYKSKLFVVGTFPFTINPGLNVSCFLTNNSLLICPVFLCSISGYIASCQMWFDFGLCTGTVAPNRGMSLWWKDFGMLGTVVPPWCCLTKSISSMQLCWNHKLLFLHFGLCTGYPYLLSFRRVWRCFFL